MLRFAILLLAGMLCFESAQAGWLEDMRAKREAERREMIKAGKMPPVRLNEKQMAILTKGMDPSKARIAWLGAGRQKDGKIFECHVVSGKDLFGARYVNLESGTFEADSSYQRSSMHLHGKDFVLKDCHRHGLEPPVTIKRSFY